MSIGYVARSGISTTGDGRRQGRLQRAGRAEVSFDEADVVGCDIDEVAGKTVFYEDAPDGRARRVRPHPDQSARLE